MEIRELGRFSPRAALEAYEQHAKRQREALVAVHTKLAKVAHQEVMMHEALRRLSAYDLSDTQRLLNEYHVDVRTLGADDTLLRDVSVRRLSQRAQAEDNLAYLAEKRRAALTIRDTILTEIDMLDAAKVSVLAPRPRSGEDEPRPSA
jgi:hypothetical protein